MNIKGIENNEIKINDLNQQIETLLSERNNLLQTQNQKQNQILQSEDYIN